MEKGQKFMQVIKNGSVWFEFPAENEANVRALLMTENVDKVCEIKPKPETAAPAPKEKEKVETKSSVEIEQKTAKTEKSKSNPKEIEK